MGVLLICGARGTIVKVRAEGQSSRECVTAIGELIADRFGEGE
jgi:phosphocarrier protein